MKQMFGLLRDTFVAKYIVLGYVMHVCENLYIIVNIISMLSVSILHLILPPMNVPIFNSAGALTGL